MTSRKRSGGGRTTPKGTKDPNRDTAKKTTESSAPVDGRRPPSRSKVAKETQRASRPISHNRGNR